MRSNGAHSSSGAFFSSIAMSFNSLASKTSPHSWHSTYSDSSSRETICTRGCLHCSGLTFFGGGGDGWLDIINLPTVHLSRGNVHFVLNGRYFAASGSRMSSTHGAYCLATLEMSPSVPIEIDPVAVHDAHEETGVSISKGVARGHFHCGMTPPEYQLTAPRPFARVRR